MVIFFIYFLSCLQRELCVLVWGASSLVVTPSQRSYLQNVRQDTIQKAYKSYGVLTSFTILLVTPRSPGHPGHWTMCFDFIRNQSLVAGEALAENFTSHHLHNAYSHSTALAQLCLNNQYVLT